VGGQDGGINGFDGFLDVGVWRQNGGCIFCDGGLDKILWRHNGGFKG